MDQEELNKQIELLAENLESLVRVVDEHLEHGSPVDTIDTVNLGMMDCLNIDIEEINNIPIQHFITTIAIDNELNNKNLDKLANLLFKTAKLFELENDRENTKRLYGRALQIYLFLAKTEDDFPYERHIRIKELRELLLQ